MAKQQAQSNTTRLANGARRIRKECRSVVWWSAARIESIRECPYNTQAFRDCANLRLFYDVLYDRAAAESTEKGLPAPVDPLNRDTLPTTDLDGVDALLRLPLKAFETCGLVVRCQLEGEPGYIGDGWANRRATKAGERVIRPDEMLQLMKLKDEAPTEFDEMWKAIWKVKEILD